ncbi:MAG: hypothetical protein M1517_10255 [Deltaproteobacteria bacterium]|nr:hypothetical protein [Deltaproteobacteria bacterium]
MSIKHLKYDLAVGCAVLVVTSMVAGCGRPGNLTSSNILPGVLTSTIDSSDDTGYFTSLAMDGNDNPWIAYYDNTAGALKLAHYNGASFVTEVVDDSGSTGWYPSLVLDARGEPHITYYDAKDHVLKYAYKTQQGWVIQTINDLNIGGYGEYSSLKLDVGGNPHFCYISHVLNDELRYGFIDSQGVLLETADSGQSQWTTTGTGNIDLTTSLQLLPNGSPVISYYDASNGILKMTQYDPATQTWDTQIVASGSELPSPDNLAASKDVGMYNSLVLDSDNDPHISYYDADYGTLRYAYFNGVIWTYQYIDTKGFAGAYNSIALDQSGNPIVAYQDVTNGAVKIAFDQKGVWKTFYVDSSDYYRTGYWISLAVAGNNGIGISYRNATTHALMFAFVNYY